MVLERSGARFSLGDDTFRFFNKTFVVKKRSGGKKTRRGLISLRSASFEIVSAAPTDYPSRVLRSRAPVAPPLPALEVVNSSTDAIYSFPRRHPPNFTFNSKIVFLLHPNLIMFFFSKYCSSYFYFPLFCLRLRIALDRWHRNSTKQRKKLE